MDWLSATKIGRAIQERGLDQWLPGYIRNRKDRRLPGPDEKVHLLLCIGDHYEPKLGGAQQPQAKERVETWCREYPKQFASFTDCDGKHPQHTFFYPEEEYEVDYLNRLADLCRAGFGEVEIHLHHDNDNAENLRQTLTNFKHKLHDAHGLLSKHKDTGELGYAFIHGNWSLDNARPDGKYCGVNNELDILRETGCFVDMTLPSAPSTTQTTTINSIYYAVDDPHCAKSHDKGIKVGKAPRPEKSLLLVQGPLLFDGSRKKWGLIPKIENACLQGSQAPSIHRIDLWLKARVQVPTRPDWFFVKLHTHGANEQNMPVLLGEPMRKLHQHLAERASKNPNFHFHYVTAREMTNLVHAAEAGHQGSVAEARDWVWRRSV